VEVIKDGGIEDSVGSLQIDFANCHLGGGVIEGGCVQEEIRFSINPELTCAMLFCENMTDLEAIVLTGAERFSNYNGYGSSLRFGGNHVDETERNEDGTVCTSIAAIDAMSYYGQFENLLKLQLTPENMARDANKALAGVKDFSSDESELECSKSKFESVATGNWGCGAFEGNIHVKFLIQWCAVSVSGRLMKYYTFEKEQASTGEMMKALAQGLTAKKVTVGDLWQIMEKLGEIANGEGDQCNVIPAVGKHFEIDIPFEGEIPDIPST
jgi:poly(ADP-ribose) glycohydrolase